MGPDTRTRLILAAMELFWEKGYFSTSMADVLRRADVHGGSLYHFFPGKQDLLLAVLDFYVVGIHEQLLKPAWEGVADPLERVWALLALYRAHIVSTDCFYGCPIGSLALEIHEPDPPVRERLAANFENWTTAVQQCLDAVSWPTEVDTRRLAEFVLTTMEGGVMLTRTYRDVAYFDRAIAELRAYVDLLRRPAPQRKRARGAEFTHKDKRGERK
jgi:TetR/AcrR family transcriptional regulator, transcriptional repressor for nem operon